MQAPVSRSEPQPSELPIGWTEKEQLRFLCHQLPSGGGLRSDFCHQWDRALEGYGGWRRSHPQPRSRPPSPSSRAGLGLGLGCGSGRGRTFPRRHSTACWTTGCHSPELPEPGRPQGPQGQKFEVKVQENEALSSIVTASFPGALARSSLCLCLCVCVHEYVCAQVCVRAFVPSPKKRTLLSLAEASAMSSFWPLCLSRAHARMQSCETLGLDCPPVDVGQRTPLSS